MLDIFSSCSSEDDEDGSVKDSLKILDFDNSSISCLREEI